MESYFRKCIRDLEVQSLFQESLVMRSVLIYFAGSLIWLNFEHRGSVPNTFSCFRHCTYFSNFVYYCLQLFVILSNT